MDLTERLMWGEFACLFARLVDSNLSVPDPTETAEGARANREARRVATTRLRGKFSRMCLLAMEAGDYRFFSWVSNELRKLVSGDSPKSDAEGIAVLNAWHECQCLQVVPTNRNIIAMIKGPALDRRSVDRIAERLGLTLAKGRVGRPRLEK